MGLGMGWDLCAGLLYEHRFAMLIKVLQMITIFYSSMTLMLMQMAKGQNHIAEQTCVVYLLELASRNVNILRSSTCHEKLQRHNALLVKRGNG